MALTPAQQAAIQQVQLHLSQLTNAQQQEALQRIIKAAGEQKRDQREQAIQQAVDAELSDPTWPDLVGIPNLPTWLGAAV